MTDKPILFSAPMIRALLDGRKTQTRRVLKPKGVARSNEYTHLRLDVLDGHLWWWDGKHDLVGASQSYPYTIGDRLWVREAWKSCSQMDGFPPRDMSPGEPRLLVADGSLHEPACLMLKPGRFRQAMHMTRWASRLTLVVTDVRVQRVQDISNADAIDEGVQPNGKAATPIDQFRDIWNRLHGPDAWGHNGWVVALTFDVHKCNIDQMK